MQASPECNVWTTSGMGTVGARVTDHAELYSMMGSLEAYWVDSTRFIVQGTMSDLEGTYQPPRVSVHGLTGDLDATLSPPNATIEGMIGDVSLTSNSACSDTQLALGTAVISVAVASQ